MTTSINSSNNPSNNAAQSVNAISSGTSSPPAAGSAPRSYANATKKQATPPPVASSNPTTSAAVPPQHGKISSVAPVNGKASISPAVPSMAAPTIVSSNTNGGPAHEHSRKASMTISAAGTSINNANGGPVGSNNRPNIAFGALNGGGGTSPAVVHSSPRPSHSSSVSANPRINSPTSSPQPIPQASGGRPPPPSSLSGQPNGQLVFGNQGADAVDPNSRPGSMQQGTPQASHLRRESSQSAHSDSLNRQYPPNAGRGRGFTPSNYAPHSSPGPRYNQPMNQPRGGAPMPGQFQGQVAPNSPFRGPRTPNMNPAQMHQQQHYANQSMPQHAYQQYPQHLQANQGPYAMMQSQPYDPNFYYAQQGYQMHPGMQFQNGPPGSPRTGYVPHQPYMQGQYGPPHSQGMQRSSSQNQPIDRPPSTLGQPSTPALSAANHAHTPSQGSASPAPSSTTFTIPAKTKSKAIVIKNADGEVMDFKKTASPASSGPVVVSSTPTPPPRASSTTGSQHSRTESKSVKSDAEKKAEFAAQMKQLANKESDDKKAAQDKADAEEKAEKEKEKQDADARAAKQKADADAKAAKDKEEADKADAAAAKAQAEETAKNDEDEKKRLEDEEMERMIAEMEAAEAKEIEQAKAYEEKKAKAKAEQAKKDAEAKANQDEELKRLEREAEEREEQKANEPAAKQDKESEDLFKSLSKPSLGPGATATESDAPAATPSAEMPPPAQPKGTVASKPKPAALKIPANKSVEPAQPTAGMQALRSARFLQLRSEAVNYPEGVSSPNPALNQSAKSKGRQYDKDFLLQFQEVFKEKPSIDWDAKLKETVGDGSDSARPQSARPGGGGGMGSRASSMRGGIPGPMGSFQQGARTLPRGTTSEERFAMGSSAPRQMTNPLAGMVGRPGGAFPMGGTQMNRQPSFGMAQPGSPHSGRNNSHRGSRRGGRGNDRQPSRREEEQAAKAMPLTAGLDLKPLELSKTGWKASSLAGPAAQPTNTGGHMAPDMVQRKVKSNLNKMTPENFDKISGQILEIAAQSEHETDGRTLRQVIQLTFEKACDEAHWASMYAKFAKRMLESISPDIKDDNVVDKQGNPVVGGGLFRKYLLNRCQEDFERGWEANLPEKPDENSDGPKMLSDEYYIAAAAKRKGLGLIQFIGELYKLNMLTLRIMHECVMRLLNFEGLPDDSSIESLVKLLRTVGATMDANEQGSQMINAYFDRINKIMAMEGLPSRLQFMLLDIVDLRKAGWKSKDDAKGPKTITEIHAEAAAASAAAEQERMRQNTRGGRMQMGRGDARSASGHMPPPDYARNQIGMDDLRKLSKNAASRTSSQSPAQFGPSSLFAGRTSSGRRGLGGPSSALGRGEESGASSRTATPPTKEPTTHTNSFSALASLNAQEEEANDVTSNPSTSPPVKKTQPVAADSTSGPDKASE